MIDDTPTLWGWWLTYGTLATWVGPCGRDHALVEAQRVFSQHRRRVVAVEDVWCRPATERDVQAFERASDRQWVPPEPEVRDVVVHPDQGEIL